MEDSAEIKGLTFEEMTALVKEIRSEGRAPFFHYTHRAGAILNGPLINDIVGDLYPTFDKQWHEAFIVPYKYKKDIESAGDL